jgi:hypothetical protein
MYDYFFNRRVTLAVVRAYSACNRSGFYELGAGADDSYDFQGSKVFRDPGDRLQVARRQPQDAGSIN